MFSVSAITSLYRLNNDDWLSAAFLDKGNHISQGCLGSILDLRSRQSFAELSPGDLKRLVRGANHRAMLGKPRSDITTLVHSPRLANRRCNEPTKSSHLVWSLTAY